MTDPHKAKGDRAEREAAALLHTLTGFPVRRKLGAGRADDEGDLEGIPDTTVQVCDWVDTVRALRIKPGECAEQQDRAGSSFGFTMLRRRGGGFLCVLTAAQMAAYVREALAGEVAAHERWEDDISGVTR